MPLPIPSAELEIRPITTLQEAIDIADVRNTGREFLTHDRREITHPAQAEWFYGRYNVEHRKGNMHAFVGYVALEPAAYGMIAHKEGTHWLTGVVAPEVQRQGHGERMFRYLIDFVFANLGDEVKLDLYRKNEKARKLYEKLLFEEDEDWKGLSGVMAMSKRKP